MIDSKWVSEMLSTLRQVNIDVKYHEDAETRTDAETQDVLHMLELKENNYHDSAKLAKRLTQIRRERRTAKDKYAQLSPIANVIASDTGRKFIQEMQEALGAMRKAEKNCTNRIYISKETGERII